MTAAAFRATVHSLRQVPSRKICQLVLELPIEETARVASIAEHGAWVGIARLQEPATPHAPPLQPDTPAKRERRSWDSIPPAQQAAIRCNDPLFRAFVEWRYKRSMTGEDSAAEFVREWCGVKSRKRIYLRSAAGEAWRKLDSAFDDWKIAERAGVI